MTAMTFAIGGIGFWMPDYLHDKPGVGSMPTTLFGAITVVALACSEPSPVRSGGAPTPVSSSTAAVVVATGRETYFGKMAASLGGRPVDLVLSDMAPNLSGIRSADEARSLELVMVAFDACQRFLRPGGALLVKAFQHEDTERVLREQRNAFEKISRRKPAASRRKNAGTAGRCG